MSDESLVCFPLVSDKPLDPEVVLRLAIKKGLDSVVILGYDKDGDEFFSSSEPGGPDVLWLLERARLELLRVADPEPE